MIRSPLPVAATRSPLRWERASWAATVSVLGSVVAHELGNGGLPSLGAVALAWSVTWLGAAQLGRTRLTWPLLIALAVLAQVSLHLIWMVHHPTASTHDARMAAGHLGAAAVSVIAAAYGEAVLWRTAELLGLSILWWRPWSEHQASPVSPVLSWAPATFASPWWPGPAPGRAPPVV